MASEDRKKIVIVGGGVIGCTTAYYLSRHAKFDPNLHQVILLEASSIAVGASGKAGGLLGLWAYPECLVPLSFKLHADLASEHDGPNRWGYRRLGCLSIRAKVTADDLGLISPNKRRKASLLREVSPPKSGPSSHVIHPRVSPPMRPSRATADVAAVQDDVKADVAAADEWTEAHDETQDHLPDAGEDREVDFAISDKRLQDDELKDQTKVEDDKGGGSVGHAKDVEGKLLRDSAATRKKPEAWQKLPKQNKRAAELMQDHVLPPDMDWFDKKNIWHSEQMGTAATAATAQVHPLQFTTTMADFARQAGVEFRLRAKVTQIGQTPEGVQRVSYEDRDTGTLHTIDDVTDVIVTAGPWTGRLVPLTKISGCKSHSVVFDADVSPYAVFTKITLPNKWVPKHRVQLGFKTRRHHGSVDPEVYARPGREVYACGEHDKKARLPDTADQIYPDESQCNDLIAYLSTASAVLARAPIKAKQACYMPCHVRKTRELDPLVGPTSTPGLWVASGHTCWGVQNGPATGLLMAEMVLDGKAKSADISSLCPTRYKV